MKKISIIYCGAMLLLGSCGTETKSLVTTAADYDKYLNTSERPSFKEAENEMAFWSKRLRPDSSGVGDLGPLAGAYTRLFESTGNATYLYNAEALYRKGMTISANNKDIYARSLAHNLISQHRFKEAAALLQATYSDKDSRKRPTELMLFDVMMELGNYVEAEAYLQKIRNTSDYNYLIRKAKWSDHIGDLDAAIKYMEDARKIAESRDSKALKIWTYSNLGDYYGHAGRIQEAYTHYLKTLELQPDNDYVKKGLAWIAYAYEENSDESRRILDSVMKNHNLPDYQLFLAELAEFDGDETAAKNHRAQFLKAVAEGNFGAMYNTYLIEVLADYEPEAALRIAAQEVQNRATPETYHLLAFANLKAGKKERALDIIKAEVEGKTFEPMALYHTALVYRANGMKKEVKALKKELAEASFELGPVLAAEIEAL